MTISSCWLVSAVHEVVGQPVELRAPLKFEASVNLRAEVILGLGICPSQDEDAPEVLQVLNTLKLWNPSTFHLQTIATK